MFKGKKREPGSTAGKALASVQKRIAAAIKFVKAETKIAIQSYTKVDADDKVECVPTEWPTFDDLLTGAVSEKTLEPIKGSGRGLPRGKIIEVYGPESTCKTTLGLQIIAAYQKQGKVCALVDVEYAWDPAWARKLGVDESMLILDQPESGDKAMDLILSLARSGKVDLILVDSAAAMDPESEQAKISGKTIPGSQAKLLSTGLRKLTPIAGQTGTTVIFLNQIRMKIGVVFGNPEMTSGGKAMLFYSSIRIELRRMKTLKKGAKAFGQLVKAKTIKNKVSAPQREVMIRLKYFKGIVGVEEMPKRKDEGDSDE